MGDTPKPRRRLCLQPSQLTQPSLTVREGFKPLPKSLANHSCVPLVASGKAERARDLIDSGQSPPSVKVFLYGSRAFALPGVITPSRVRHVFLHPRFRRPLERGSMSGVTKRCNGIKRKGTQSPFSQRRPAFSIVGVKIWRTPKGQRLESHTKTLMERASSRNQLSLLPRIGEGLGEWFEAPSYEEGVGVDGR